MVRESIALFERFDVGDWYMREVLGARNSSVLTGKDPRRSLGTGYVQES